MESYFDDIHKKGLHLHAIKAHESTKEITEEKLPTQKKPDTRTENNIIKPIIQPAQKSKKPRIVRKPKTKLEKRVIKNSKEVYDFIN
jgi:murein L,D-transpeptidase YafK